MNDELLETESGGARLELRETAPPATRMSRATSAALGGAKRLLIGQPRPTRELGETLLPKTLALPIFASDSISSVAYATEAALAVLVVASLSGRDLVLPISAAIAVLLAIVALGRPVPELA